MKSALATIELNGVKIRVTLDQFRKLVREGRVTDDTPTWFRGRRVFEETAEASKAFSGFGSDVIAEENRAIR